MASNIKKDTEKKIAGGHLCLTVMLIYLVVTKQSQRPSNNNFNTIQVKKISMFQSTILIATKF